MADVSPQAASAIASLERRYYWARGWTFGRDGNRLTASRGADRVDGRSAEELGVRMHAKWHEALVSRFRWQAPGA